MTIHSLSWLLSFTTPSYCPGGQKCRSVCSEELIKLPFQYNASLCAWHIFPATPSQPQEADLGEGEQALTYLLALLYSLCELGVHTWTPLLHFILFKL